MATRIVHSFFVVSPQVAPLLKAQRELMARAGKKKVFPTFDVNTSEVRDSLGRATARPSKNSVRPVRVGCPKEHFVAVSQSDSFCSFYGQSMWSLLFSIGELSLGKRRHFELVFVRADVCVHK